MTEFAVAVDGLEKVFRFRGGRRSSTELVAVDDVSFAVASGSSLAIVGESGSGKTTIARIILGLESPSAGQVTIAGRARRYGRLTRKERRRRGRESQIVFQDPYSSLDPRQTVGACLEEVLRFHFDMDKPSRTQRVAELLSSVGLEESHSSRLPRTLSGGQRQRVAIARALAAQPAVLVLDEAVAALDVSIQAQVLNLLADLREATGVSYLFISHDLGVVRQVTDDIVVMRDGRIVEQGATQTILDAPQHQYTQRLLAAVPRPGWKPADVTGLAIVPRDD